MRNREIKQKLQDLEARLTVIETGLQRQIQDLNRNLGTIQNKLNAQARSLNRLLQFAAQSTGLEPFDPPDTHDGVTWSE